MAPLDPGSPMRVATAGGAPPTYLVRTGSSGSLAGLAMAGMAGSSSLRSSLDLGSPASRRNSSGTLLARTGSGQMGSGARSTPGSRAGSAARGGAVHSAYAPPASQGVDDYDNIKVAVRVRPPNAAELVRGDTQALFINQADFRLLQLLLPGTRGGPPATRPFTFHACLGPESRQQDVMRLCGIPQLLDAGAVDGREEWWAGTSPGQLAVLLDVTATTLPARVPGC